MLAVLPKEYTFWNVIEEPPSAMSSKMVTIALEGTVRPVISSFHTS